MGDDARSMVAMQGQIATKRANLDSWWQEIGMRVMPSTAQFTTTDAEGTKRTERIFSGRAVTANERFAAVLDDLLTPRSQVWHQLACDDYRVEDDQQVKAYFQEVNKILFSERYRPHANYASQKTEGYLSVGAYGNSCLFTDEEVGYGLRYRNIFLKECYWQQNHQGMIDTNCRRFPLTARNAMKMAKEHKWKLPERITACADKEPHKEFEFLHVVQPNQERVQSRKDFRGMPWSSHYILIEGEVMLSESGYTSFPYSFGRYMLGPNESYARSPAMACWGAILTLNEQKKTILRAGQKEVDPPLLLTEDGVLDAFNLRPGALNHGAISADGTPLVQPLKTGANIPLGFEMMGLEGQEIDDSFLVTIFKVLTEHPQMTATQVLEIAQQKGVLLAPTMGRFHSEDLGPQIERETDLLSKAGKLPPMPDALRELGGTYKIEYRSPLARAMRAQDGVAIMRTLEALPIAMQVDPNAALVVDIPASLREVAEINGMPAKLIRDSKMVARLQQQNKQAEEQAQAVAVAPEISQAALNAAKAEQIRTGA